MAKLMYKEVDVAKRDGREAITVAEAKEMLGWRVAATGEDFKKEFLFRDLEGNKVRLENNPTNRPFRMALALRYMNEILRGKWYLNGETLILDRLGHVQSGQHRLVGLVLAEQERQKNPRTWAEHGTTKPVTMDGIVVVGIDEAKEVADSLDLGQKRSLGDVVFRRNEFAETDSLGKSAKRLSNLLAYALRLVWLRVGGMQVSDAPNFPHSEALGFLEQHPRIKECLTFIFGEDGGAEKRISKFLSLGYASGLMYLMASAKTEKDAEELDFSLWDKAAKFWTLVASGADLAKGDPIHTLREALSRVNAGGGKERDQLIGMVVKAWNAYVDGEELGAKDIKVKERKDEETGKLIPAEYPRIGGLDVEPEGGNGLTAVGDWEVGQTVWVNDVNGYHWQGTVTGFDNRDWAYVDGEDDGVVATYSVAIEDLRTEQPPLSGEAKEIVEKEAEDAKAEAAGNGEEPAPKGKRAKKSSKVTAAAK